MTEETHSPTRRSPRLHHEVMVGVTSDGGSFSGWGTNLASGGVFVNSQSAPPVGTHVSVLLQLPGAGDCKLPGRVVWSKPSGPEVAEPGMGTEFVDPDETTRTQVGQMVARLSQDLSAKA